MTLYLANFTIQHEYFKYSVMNPKLALNIEEIEKDHQDEEDEYLIRGEEENEEQASQEEDESQNDNEDSNNQEEMVEKESQMLADSSPSREFQSIETFGNHKQHLNHQQFLSSLTKNHKFPFYNPQNIPKQSYKLPETPIEANNIQNSVSNNKIHSSADEHSSVDYEINRIIEKVMFREKKEKLGISDYRKDIEKVNKIDRVNKELLNQNARLIEEINELSKKMNKLYTKFPKKSKQKDQSLSQKDSNLAATLKKYRQKLSKVLDLNSRLQTSLQSEKSRSYLISNTQRSVLSKIQGISASAINYSCSNRSKTDREDSKRRVLLCEKCCRQLKRQESEDVPSKGPLFSPVLQVKQYAINSDKKSKQISNFEPTERKMVIQTACQTNIENYEQSTQLLALQKQERELQAVIQRNNQTIQQCEKSLYRIVELN